MGKIKGQRVGSIKQLKQKLQTGGGGGSFIKYVPKESSVMVRFLTEPDDFYGYWEHFDSTIRRSYACVEDNCPGCATDEDNNFTYVANALDLEEDKVVPLQLKKTVVTDLMLRYEKYGTITDRDYEVGRTGEGKQGTRYYVTPEPPKTRKLAKYDLLDLEAVVQAAFEQNTKLLRGDDDDDDDDEPVRPAAKKAPPAKRPAKKAAAKPEPEPVTYTEAELDAMDEDELTAAAESVGVDVDAFEDWDEVMAAILETAGDTSGDEDDDDEDEDTDDEDDEDDEDEEEEEDADDEDFWTEEELKAKSPGELKAIAKDYDISTKGLRPAQIIEKLLDA